MTRAFLLSTLVAVSSTTFLLPSAHGPGPTPLAIASQAERAADDPLDAVAAAPDSHIVLLENDRVRVVRVEIAPGEKEPPHTHRNPSVMIVYEPTRIRYYSASGELEFESPEGAREESATEPKWMEPEPLHAVENIDQAPYRAYRIEVK